MNTLEWFQMFLQQVENTPQVEQMKNTVEDSPWHREANTWIHSLMTINVYMTKFYAHRTERQRMLTLMSLVFHDVGKPEAEEKLEKKEQPGVFYHRYAGHEPISANEFMSFMCDNVELREAFAEDYNWTDVRKIKVMIEHHLPYGLKNEQKRQNLKYMLEMTLGEDEICFYDMLRSDCHGRISDDHDTKKANVEEWIENFQLVTYKPRKVAVYAPILFMLVGVSGAGKSTYIKNIIDKVETMVVFSEDELEYAEMHLDRTDYLAWNAMSTAQRYDTAWKFCHLNKESKFDQYSKAKYLELVATGKNIIVDCMNHGRKARNRYIQPAKDKGYKVLSVEFFISEQTAKDRQKERGDKQLNDFRVHQLFMQLETPWYGPEVDGFSIIPPP